MYFDKEEFKDEMYLCGPNNGDNIIIVGLKIIEMVITAFVMVFVCLRIGKKVSNKCMPFEEAQRLYKEYGIIIN